MMLITSCSSDSKMIAVQERNTWFMQYPGEEDAALPIYCMANEHEKGASPVCYQAKLETGKHPIPIKVQKKPQMEAVKTQEDLPNTAVELDNR